MTVIITLLREKCLKDSVYGKYS